MKTIKSNVKQFEKDFVKNFWRGLGDVSQLNLDGPFKHGIYASKSMGDKDDDIPVVLLNTLYTPEYFSFVCRELLNVELLPFQAVVIWQMWNHPFPLVVCTRGFGKTFLLGVYALLRCLLYQGTKVVVVGSAFRQSKMVFEYAEHIWSNAPILRNICSAMPRSGPRKETDKWTLYIGESTTVAIPVGCLSENSLVTTDKGIKYIKTLKTENFKVYGNDSFKYMGFFFDNGITSSVKVTTKCGYEYCATPNHKMKVVRNSNIEWARTDEMKAGDRILIDRTERWHDNQTEVTEDQAYCLGLFLGDGCYTDEYYLRYTTIDKELLEVLNNTIGYFRPDKDGLHYQLNGKKTRQDWLDFWGITGNFYHNQKSLPDKILGSNKECMTACLQGLFDSDGHVTCLESKGYKSYVVGYTTTSERLARELQYILLHYGIICRTYIRDRKSPRSGKPAKRCYNLTITGKDVQIFAEKIGFRLKRKQNKLLEGLASKTRQYSVGDSVSGVYDYFKNQKSILVKDRKTFPCSKIEEALKLNLPDNIRQLCNKDYFYDEVKLIEASIEQPMYDINIPKDNEYCANGFFSHNTGEKIRGLRANVVIADEFAAQSREIYEVVIAGFGVVSANPVENVKRHAEDMAREQLGLPVVIDTDANRKLNQNILSGTADYSFNHFFSYWQTYKSIINSKGDYQKLEGIFPEGIPTAFDWKDYVVIRVPYELLPTKYMDDKQVARAKGNINKSSYLREYGACFVGDSDGFYKRTLIESCVCGNQVPILIDGHEINFYPSLRGSQVSKYVYGVDPASEKDNFTIFVLELHKTHRRIVYGWSMNRKRHRDILLHKLSNETDYYAFCSRKLRDLMKIFPCEIMGLDSQGGGIAIEESLHDKDKLQAGELPIWPIIEESKSRDSDGNTGLHILQIVNFADSNWVSAANHGMKKDFEEKILLFPKFDTAMVGMAFEEDQAAGRIYDNMEDCLLEIEELKDELTTIMHTQTSVQNRERWDTPEEKLPGGKKGRQRKDRYSALLIANMIARTLQRTDIVDIQCTNYGGFAHNLAKNKADSNKAYVCSDANLQAALNKLYSGV